MTFYPDYIIYSQDETGVYKNLLQEVSQRVAASLPIYTTFRSGIGHLPFNCTVELAGIRFTGEPAKNKKQAEKNAAMTAWSSLKLRKLCLLALRCSHKRLLFRMIQIVFPIARYRWKIMSNPGLK